MVGSTALRFKPQLFPDSIIIFVLGFSETLIIYHIFSDLYLWCYSMAIVTFVEMLSMVNGIKNARQLPENDIIFQQLGYWPKLYQILFSCTSLLYIILGYISYQFANILTIEYFIASVFLIFTILFLAGTFNYWRIIVKSTT
jgi:hypothetical protein